MCYSFFRKLQGRVTDPWTADVPGIEFPTGGTVREPHNFCVLTRCNSDTDSDSLDGRNDLAHRSGVVSVCPKACLSGVFLCLQ